MNSAKRYIAIAFSFALCMTVFAAFAPRIAHAVTATLVQVVNTPSAPIPTQPVHARQAVQLNANTIFGPNVPGGTEFYSADGGNTRYVVPAGKRLVLESETARCQLPTGQAVLWPVTQADTNLPATVGFSQHFDGTLFGVDYYSLTGNGSLYVDPGLQILVNWFRTANSGTASCSFDLTAHLEDIQ